MSELPHLDGKKCRCADDPGASLSPQRKPALLPQGSQRWSTGPASSKSDSRAGAEDGNTDLEEIDNIFSSCIRSRSSGRLWCYLEDIEECLEDFDEASTAKYKNENTYNDAAKNEWWTYDLCSLEMANSPANSPVKPRGPTRRGSATTVRELFVRAPVFGEVIGFHFV